MTKMKDYVWRVIQSNDRQGFRKTFMVTAPTALWAINEAGAELMALGYEKTIDDFYVVEVVRLQEVEK